MLKALFRVGDDRVFPRNLRFRKRRQRRTNNLRIPRTRDFFYTTLRISINFAQGRDNSILHCPEIALVLFAKFY